MSNELDQYYTEQIERVRTLASADAEGTTLEEVFTQQSLDTLEDFEVIDNPTLAYHNQRGSKANAFAISEDQRSFDLVITDFHNKDQRATSGQQHVAKLANRAKGFIEQSLNGLHLEIDVTSLAHEMARAIHEAKGDIETIRIILLTNATVSRAKLKDEEFQGFRITYQIWDVDRVYRVESSNKGREEIILHLNPPIPCVMDEDNDVYTTYLAVVPGNTLADAYSEWGLRLLERNVRAYLQLRGDVNKGIHTTLKEKPNLFLTYNNGLSAVAEDVNIVVKDGMPCIASITDLQIVNGGQTTASLHRAVHIEKFDIGPAKVQMKLTCIRDPEKAEDIIPKISQFSNTQNKVEVADFASNEEYHLQLEKLSRTIFAPKLHDSSTVTYWFYERIRRQYDVEKAREKTPANKRAWAARYPKNQLFDKTNLAKALNTFDELPHVVALGKQKNFARFTERTKKEQPVVDEVYYKETVAKVLIWKRAYKLVLSNTPQGHKQNTCAYALAYLQHRSGHKFNFSKVWNDQGLSSEFEAHFIRLANRIHHFLTHPHESVAYLSEWHKKEECWQALKRENFEDADALKGAYSAEAAFNAAQVTEEEALSSVAQVEGFGTAVWPALAKWLAQKRLLNTSYTTACFKVGIALQKGGEPKVQQATRALYAMEQAINNGFDPTQYMEDETGGT